MINNSGGAISPTRLAVGEAADIEFAKALALKLNIEIAAEEPKAESGELYLRLSESGLSLVQDGRELRGDFSTLLPRIRRDRLGSEMLIKASKLKCADGEKTAIDATAGLGEDAFLLAAAGFSVTLFERDPVIAALLADAIRRAMSSPETASVAGRMQLVGSDSLEALPKLETRPGVILLDPMFPERQKSALIKKKFQLLQQLELPCDDEAELLAAALAAHPKKIVIKRPLKGPFLAGRKPDYSLSGKAIRYDCIVMA